MVQLDSQLNWCGTIEFANELCGQMPILDKTSNDAPHPRKSWTTSHDAPNPRKSWTKPDKMRRIPGNPGKIPEKTSQEDASLGWLLFRQAMLRPLARAISKHFAVV